MTALVWGDELLKYDFGSYHPLRSERCKLGVEEILSSEKSALIDVVEPRYATEDELELFHTRKYIESVRKGTAGDIDTPVSPDLYEPAKLSVGATLTAVDEIVEGYDIGVNICGGWHHAFEDRARGFCIFNDVVIGARYAQKKGFKKVMIIDWDVHHGDGTQRAFYNDESVFTISIHQHPSTIYPYRTGYESENNEYNMNIPITPGEDEQEVLKRVLSEIPLKIRSFKPALMIIQMGVDGHRDDPMSSLNLTDRFYESVAQIAARCSKNNNFPVVLLGGGGFNFPKTAQLWRKMVEIFTEEKA